MKNRGDGQTHHGGTQISSLDLHRDENQPAIGWLQQWQRIQNSDNHHISHWNRDAGETEQPRQDLQWTAEASRARMFLPSHARHGDRSLLGAEQPATKCLVRSLPTPFFHLWCDELADLVLALVNIVRDTAAGGDSKGCESTNGEPQMQFPSSFAVVRKQCQEGFWAVVDKNAIRVMSATASHPSLQFNDLLFFFKSLIDVVITTWIKSTLVQFVPAFHELCRCLVSSCPSQPMGAQKRSQ